MEGMLNIDDLSLLLFIEKIMLILRLLLLKGC